MAKNWAELPRELLGRILNKLCIDSIDYFKIVCHPWYAAVVEEANLSLLCPVPSPPWLTIPKSRSESDDDDDGEKEKKDLSSARFFNPTNNKVYYFQDKEMKRWLPDHEKAVCVGSSHGWLAFIDTRCVIYLTNPFKKPDIDDEYRRIQLPSIETLPCILGVEREYLSPSGAVIIDFKCLDYIGNETSTQLSIDLYEFFILKLVVSSAPDDHDDDDGNDCTVMAIFCEYHDLAFCKLGDTSWTTLNKPTMRNGEGGQFATLPSYEDIHFSSNDQCFYALRHSGSFDIWDLRTPLPKCTYIDLPKIPSVPPSLSSLEKWLISWCTCRKYLVNFLGNTLLVIKSVAVEVTQDGLDDDEPHFPHKTIGFDVYKLDWVQKQWVVHVRGLGNNRDGVLFLGNNNAMTSSACDFPALRGNSIYFTDDIYDLRAKELPFVGHDSGIFGLEDSSIHPCFYPENYFKRIFPPPVWIAPNPW